MNELRPARISARELQRMALKQSRPTIVDRAIEWWNPAAGARRRRARYQNAVMNLAGAGAFSEDLGGRGMKSKSGLPNRSPDQDILPDLNQLRRISRNLYYTNGLARGLIRTNTTAVVGTGLRLKARPNKAALGLTIEQAREWATQVEREFNFHFGREHCDAERKNNLARLGFMVLLQTYLNGDSVTILPRVRGRTDSTPYTTGVQLIESDRLSTPYDKRSAIDVVDGIRFSQFGEPLTYYVSKYHPGDIRLRSYQEWRPIPARGVNGRRNVIHFFDQERPQQSRGVPFLAPVITLLKKLGDFTDAELDATVVSSLLTVFVKSEDDVAGGLDDILPDQASTKTTGARADDEDIKLGSGSIVDLAPGESVETVTPGRPNTAFDAFVLAIARQMSAATGIPVEVIFKHFTASYSASRGALLEAWRYWKQSRMWLAQGWYQPIYEAWLDEAVAIGRIDAPGYFEDPFIRQAWRGTLWAGDAPAQIDEVKQIDAATKRIEAKLSTRHRESLELTGEPWEEIVEELDDEEQTLEERGLSQVTPAQTAPGAQPGQSAADMDQQEQLEAMQQ